ncbi:MAG: hypothetical protein M0R51_15000 [Clostridia bacterium]|jgi:hypothetical protein|nr:hypothetical protein [Clostridia bacterium]
MSKIVPMLALMAVLMVGVSYMYGVLSANDENINVIGTAYEQSYKSNAAVQSATSSLFTPIAAMIGIMMLIFGISALKNKGRY